MCLPGLCLRLCLRVPSAPPSPKYGGSLGHALLPGVRLRLLLHLLRHRRRQHRQGTPGVAGGGVGRGANRVQPAADGHGGCWGTGEGGGCESGCGREGAVRMRCAVKRPRPSLLPPPRTAPLPFPPTRSPPQPLTSPGHFGHGPRHHLDRCLPLLGSAAPHVGLPLRGETRGVSTAGVPWQGKMRGSVGVVRGEAHEMTGLWLASANGQQRWIRSNALATSLC